MLFEPFQVDVMYFFFQPNEMSREESAAVCIQAHFRGYLARKVFVQLLYDKYMKVQYVRPIFSDHVSHMWVEFGLRDAPIS